MICDLLAMIMPIMIAMIIIITMMIIDGIIYTTIMTTIMIMMNKDSIMFLLINNINKENKTKHYQLSQAFG